MRNGSESRRKKNQKVQIKLFTTFCFSWLHELLLTEDLHAIQPLYIPNIFPFSIKKNDYSHD